MLLLIGLGNPGAGYAGHRHNIGFMAIDAIADALRAPPFRAKFQGQLTEARSGDDRMLLLKPQTYMNLSGQSGAEAARFHKIANDKVVVFHDELDLAPGKVRLKRGGGAAGHNGLRSLDSHIGNDYWRVRLGIGHPGDKALVHNYVLGNFAKSEAVWVEALMAALVACLPKLVAGDMAGYQNDVALAMQRAGV